VELPVAEGRRSLGTDGRIDLVAEYGANTIGVIELKKGELDISHLVQLEDYLSETQQIEAKVRDSSEDNQVSFIGVLVGLSINSDLREKIESGYLTNNKIPIAALTMRRYRGDDGSIYVVTDTFFHSAVQSMDRTKYKFNGAVFTKGRLVLAVMKQHVLENPELTYSQLEKAFPKILQSKRVKGYGVFGTAEIAQEIFDKSPGKRNRHFRNAEDLIDLKDATIAVCNQWGIDNIGDFLNMAESLGHRIQPI
jgi:hypothetical protein